MKQRMMRDKSALTLIEVLVVIAVLEVLSLWLLAWAVSRRPASADLSIRQVCEMQDTARQNSPKDLLSPSVSSCKMARMAGSDDESKLIEQSLSGDPEAYAALVRQHQNMIRSVAFRMTGSLPDAEDLAQDAFLRAYQQLGSFGRASKFSTWLCKIVINLSLDRRRRESRRGDIHAKWAADLASAQAPDGRFPDELSRRVQLALDRLPAKQRAAIVLTIYEDQSHAEAAKTLGCAEATISWRVFAARRKLKRLLKDLPHERHSP